VPASWRASASVNIKPDRMAAKKWCNRMGTENSRQLLYKRSNELHPILKKPALNPTLYSNEPPATCSTKKTSRLFK
jgi:hypothetical protein